MKAPLRIATRGSPLALVQARAVQALLAEHCGFAAVLVEVKTSGDRIQDRPLREVGGKGLFTKEIEETLLSDGADLAVHSAKDMPTESRVGLTLAAVLPRADVRDVLISPQGHTLKTLPPGARVGTTSLRRQAQLKRGRPDLAVLDLRGNVETRLKKLDDGLYDAILLAAAGLARLGLAPKGAVPLSLDEMLPAAGQGAIAIEIRAGNTALAQALATINHAPSFAALEAERAYLAVLNGSCRSPIAGHLRFTQGRAHMSGLVLAPDGGEAYADAAEGPATDALALARAVAETIRRKAPAPFRAAYLEGE